ncbi:MAG: sugar phosphate isomerase/epimerase family protein [Planctomycetota bacterium]|jgi:sugar phosphate isomerase/epimerase
MNQLAINTVGDELEASAEFCRAEGMGIEVTDFVFPDNLDGDLTGRIDRHVKAVEGITPLISHGPFLDLIANSPDPLIVDVSRKRHQASLTAASEIGAGLYVAHTNYNAFIKNPSYRRDFTAGMCDFWLPFADWAAKQNIVICLENFWEPDPDIQAELVAKADHPCLKASFDNGHALLFSKESSANWIKVLGLGLSHCHLHDNRGQMDEHNPIGEGKEDWPELVNAIRTFSPQAVLVAESDRLDKNKLSIEKLKSF